MTAPDYDRDEELAEQAPPLEDLVRLYLHEIGQYKLLTAAQEVELALRIKQGTSASTRLNTPGLRAKERLKLEYLVERAAIARHDLINANLRLVVSIAKKHVGRGVAMMDLIQEGNIGLMRAVEKFDYTRGNRFSTYASWWISQAVTRAIAEKSRLIRLPVHMHEQVQAARYESGRLLQRLGRQARTEELAAALGKSPEKTRQIQQLCKYTTSLDQPVGEDQERVLGDFLAAPEEDTDRAAVLAHLRERLAYATQELTERQRRVLALRYGLDGGAPQTLELVGQAIGMTRERARQIETEAIKRVVERAPDLGQFLEALCCT